jgi:F-type H+-transporting ATPase subunit b
MLRQPILAFGLLAPTLFFLVPTTPALGEAPPTASAVAEQGPAEKKEATHAPAAAPAKEGAPHAAEAKQPDITEVQSPLAIWTLVVFVCLLLVLRRFAWKPLMKALDEREAHLEHVLLDSERARNEAEALAAQHRRELAQAADQVRALMEEARKEAQASADSIIRRAQAEAEAARKRAEREIANARDQALMEIWSNTAELAVSVAGRVLNKELNESDHRRLVEVALGELPANGQQGARA